MDDQASSENSTSKIDFSAVHFSPISAQQAKAIAAWNYAPPYELYNAPGPDGRNGLLASLMQTDNHYYAGVDEHGEVVAFYCFGEDARVLGGDYSVDALDLGGGIRPDLTGLGLGKEFWRTGIAMAQKLFAPSCLRMTIAAFNTRAQRVAQSLSFIEKQRFIRETDQTQFVVMRSTPG